MSYSSALMINENGAFDLLNELIGMSSGSRKARPRAILGFPKRSIQCAMPTSRLA